MSFARAPASRGVSPGQRRPRSPAVSRAGARTPVREAASPLPADRSAHAAAALSDAVARLQSLSVDFKRQENGYMVAKSREMLGAKGGAAGRRSAAEAQRAKEEVQQMKADLHKKAERLKEARVAVNREKHAASVAKQQAVKMRRELEEIEVNLERERSKREKLQQANERLKWKLQNAERRADDASFAASEAFGYNSLRPANSTVARHQPVGSARLGRRRPEPGAAREAVLAQPKGGRGTLKAKPPTLERLDLHQAASAGDCARIKQLLDEGWPVDGLNAERETPLHWAANLGHTKAVHLLLSRFADPTLKDRWGHTAAAQALSKGHYAVADMLEDGEDRWDEIKEEQGRREVSVETGREEHPLRVFVSHNRGDPLDLSLPRNTTYSGLMRLLKEYLCESDGDDIEELLCISDSGDGSSVDAKEMLDEDFEELVGPHVERPYLELQAEVTSDSTTGVDEQETSIQERLSKIQDEVPHWNAADVETWLVEVVQLPQYVDIFRDNEVDGELLLWLQELNLQEDLEITDVSHRQRIAEQIDLLRPPGHSSVPMDITDAQNSPHAPDLDRAAAAEAIQAMWRGYATRTQTRYAKPVNIIRRFEQLKSGAADELDEQDLAEEVRSELAFIGEQLREQLANSKSKAQPPDRPSSALSELREFNSELESSTVRSSPSPAEVVRSSPVTLAATPVTPTAVLDETSADSPGFLPRPDVLRAGASPALVPDTRNTPRQVTEVKGDRISVAIHEQGKLGLNFGSGGATWPVVESIAPDGLVAQFPELTRVCLLSAQLLRFLPVT